MRCAPTAMQILDAITPGLEYLRANLPMPIDVIVSGFEDGEDANGWVIRIERAKGADLCEV